MDFIVERVTPREICFVLITVVTKTFRKSDGKFKLLVLTFFLKDLIKNWPFLQLNVLTFGKIMENRSPTGASSWAKTK